MGLSLFWLRVKRPEAGYDFLMDSAEKRKIIYLKHIRTD